MIIDGIFINSDNLKQIATELKNKNKEIEDCYKEIKERAKIVDGTTENWQCKQQEKYYNTLTYITDRYEQSVSKLNEIYDFLCKIISDYEEHEEERDTHLNTNAENFDM